MIDIFQIQDIFGGTGLGAGATVSQSLTYGFKTGWSTSSSLGVYGSLGPFNASASGSYTYNMDNKQGSWGWGLGAGINLLGDPERGVGLSVSYGSGGWGLGLGGYYNSPDEVYTSPVSDNFGKIGDDGRCVFLALEEFSKSYGLEEYNLAYWEDRNGGLGVHPNNISNLISSSNVFTSSPITDINSIALALKNDQRVLVGFNYNDHSGKSLGHAVMVKKVQIWNSGSGKHKIFFAETSPIRIAPSFTTKMQHSNWTRLWYWRVSP